MNDMKKYISALSGCLILGFLLLSEGMQGQDLVILHTNDTHSQIVPQTSGRGQGLGGYERREEYVKKVRADHKNVLLLDAGDFSQGTPYFSLFKGDVEIELMNAIGYDAACVGNHEFDNGEAELARRIKNADFPVVCANYDLTDSPLKDLIKPYTVIKKDGKKIGIIGILCSLGSLASPKNIEGMKYEHPVRIMNRLALKLKNEEKCDLIIALTHVGYDHGTIQNPSDDILAENSENVDIIIGGHSHTYINKPAVIKNKLGKDVIVVTAGAKGELVGRIDWYWGAKE